MKTPTLKKIAAIAGSAVILSALYAAETNADTATSSTDVSAGYLKVIASNTGAISDTVTQVLAQLNSLPNYISTMVTYALDMTQKDGDASSPFVPLQTQFGNIGSAITNDAAKQLSNQLALDTSTLGANPTPASVIQARKLFYSSLLTNYANSPLPPNPNGTPASPVSPSDNPATGYVANASGFNIAHEMPSGKWAGKPADIGRYYAYYNTTMAAQSFGAYALGGQLADMQNGGALTNAQQALVTLATNSSNDSSNWFATVASEEIGKVLRQLLLFESQNYVLTTQMLQTQKQLLAAQVVTNSLLIAIGQDTEKKLLSAAIKPQP